MNSNSVFNNKNSNVLDINMNDIEIKEKIGEGGFATINKGKWLFLDVAVKIIFDPKVTQELLDEFNNEIKMLAVFKHPNIVSLLATCSKPKLAIVMEHVSRGSLYNVLHKER
jgi:serine/threonine protein kinase